MEPGGLCNARAMSLMDSPAFHRSHNSFLPAADNPPGRPSLATPAPPIRTTPKTLPCCTDRLNPPRVSFDWGVGSRDGRAWLGSYHQRVERLRAARAVPPPWPGALRGDEGDTRAAHTGVGRRVRSPRRGGQLRRAGADALSVHGQESRPRRRGYSGAGGVYHPRRAGGRARRRRGGGAVFGRRGGWLRPGGRAQRGRRAGHSLGARYLPGGCGWLRRRRETPMVRGSRSRRAARASSSLSCVRPALIRPYLRSGPTLVAQWQACSGWQGATRWYWQASSCRWGRSRTALLGSLVAGEAFASGLHLAGYICAGAFLVGAVLSFSYLNTPGKGSTEQE